MKLRYTSIPLALLIAACGASTPSPELVDARTQYEQAQAAPSSQLALDSLYEAKKSLDEAEEAHQESPNSYEERSKAYIAARKAELAVAKAGIAQAGKSKTEHEQALVSRQGDMIDSSRKDAQQSQKQVEQTRNALTSQTQQLRRTEAELEKERLAREQAQKEARAALQSLQDVARVKSEDRRTTISLDGSVLFLVGQSTLLPIANHTLDRVAKTLTDLEPGSTLRIEGHTDSQGSADNNMELSRQRAQTVADYIIRKGVPAKDVEVAGMGESQPVASNDTPEGRANNRRVEIIVQHQQPSSQGTQQQGTQQQGAQQQGAQQQSSSATGGSPAAGQ